MEDSTSNVCFAFKLFCHYEKMPSCETRMIRVQSNFWRVDCVDSFAFHYHTRMVWILFRNEFSRFLGKTQKFRSRFFFQNGLTVLSGGLLSFPGMACRIFYPATVNDSIMSSSILTIFFRRDKKLKRRTSPLQQCHWNVAITIGGKPPLTACYVVST